MVAALTTSVRGEVATQVRRSLSADSRNGLHCWHAVTQMVQTTGSGRTIIVNGTTQIVQAREECERASSRGHGGSWPALSTSQRSQKVPPDSVRTAVMRAMLPRDMQERVLDGPFNYEELRTLVSAHVDKSLVDKRRTMELSRWTLNKSTIPTRVMRCQCRALGSQGTRRPNRVRSR